MIPLSSTPESGALMLSGASGIDDLCVRAAGTWTTFATLFLAREVFAPAGGADDAGIRQGRGYQPHRANRIVIRGDHEIHQIRIAIGVGGGNEWDLELACLVDRNQLLRGVDDDHHLRYRAHALEPTNVLFEACSLLVEPHRLFFGQLLVGPVL